MFKGGGAGRRARGRVHGGGQDWVGLRLRPSGEQGGGPTLDGAWSGAGTEAGLGPGGRGPRGDRNGGGGARSSVYTSLEEWLAGVREGL